MPQSPTASASGGRARGRPRPTSGSRLRARASGGPAALRGPPAGPPAPAAADPRRYSAPITASGTVTVERSAGVATVTLDHPAKKNALGAAMWAELTAVLGAVAANPDDRVVVVTGAGGDFCSGADLTDPAMLGPGVPAAVAMGRLNGAVRALHRLPKPTIARVDGVAVGAGMNLALGCDFVVASDRARFSEIFARRGLAIDAGGSWLLPRLVGLRKAKELAMLGEMIPAPEAAALGLINTVVPIASLDAVVEGWARRLAAGPTVALGLTKAMLDGSSAASLDQALEAEARSQELALSTRDAAEAMEAFIARRDPQFRGH